MNDATNTKMFNGSNTDHEMELAYIVALEEDEDGCFVATIPTLRGCITQGGSPKEALDRLTNALRGWVEVAEKRGLYIPPPP